MKIRVIAVSALAALSLTGCATHHFKHVPNPTRTTTAPVTSPATTRPTKPPTTPTATPTHDPTTPAASHAKTRRAVAPTSSGGFTCADGTISHAKHRQGACSHHGGVR